jgi:hypothetical protein
MKKVVIAVLAALVVVAFVGDAFSQTPEVGQKAALSTPWSFDLSLYIWLPSINAGMSAGPLRVSINESVTDIWNDTKGVPLIAMGRAEAHRDRLGFFLDTSYFDLDFKDKRIAGADTAVTSQMGLLDYALMYRICGDPKGDISGWAQKSRPPRVDVYAGGRTLWLKNQIERPFISESASKTLTAPIVGARAIVDINPRWTFLVDGNLGGFDVDNIRFTGAAMGLFGYRFTIARIPTSLMFGYKLLYYDVDSGPLKVNATLHGPVTGLVFSW